MPEEIDKSSAWVNEFLIKLEAAANNVLTVDLGNGLTIKAEITSELKDFFLENRFLLIKIGKETFKSFLFLISQKKDEDAFMLLLNKMNADELISRMNSNALSLGQYTTNVENFISKIKIFLLNESLRIAVKALLAILI